MPVPGLGHGKDQLHPSKTAGRTGEETGKRFATRHGDPSLGLSHRARPEGSPVAKPGDPYRKTHRTRKESGRRAAVARQPRLPSCRRQAGRELKVKTQRPLLPRRDPIPRADGEGKAQRGGARGPHAPLSGESGVPLPFPPRRAR